MSLIRPAAWTDERLAPFRDVSDADLRRREGLFLAEGRLVVRRLLGLASPERQQSRGRCRPRAVLVSDAALAALQDALEPWLPVLPVYVVPAAWMEPITGFNLHRGCLAIGERPADGEWHALAGRSRRLLVLEGVGNPDNVGGLFRTAHALGVDGVLLGPGTGDPLYRKAIRVSCGAALSLPFANLQPWPGALMQLADAGFDVWALTPATDAETVSAACAAGVPQRLALMVGAEGPGLTADALRAATRRVRIPIAPEADSLNVTVAAGIVLAALASPPSG